MNSNIEKAITQLLITSPFFGSLLLKLPVTINNAQPTARISVNGVQVNEPWFDNLTTGQRVHLLAHEVGHHVLQHLTRGQKYLDHNTGPDGQPLDPTLWNAAVDFIDNQMLLDEKIGDPIPGGCYWPGGLKLAEESPESLYNRLKQKGGGSGAGGQAFDTHDLSKADPDALPPPIDATAIAAAAGTAKMMGKHVPDVVERLLGELKRPTFNPWRRLRSAINTARGQLAESSWRRLNRRMIVRGIGMPGRTKVGPDTVTVIIDVSGSIDDAMVSLFLGHVASILDTVRPAHIYLLWVDTAVQREDIVRQPGDLHLIAKKGAPGGGGTDMTVGVRRAAALGSDVIVCLTDGYTPFGDRHLTGPRQQMVWAITTDVRAPWGDTVTLR